MSRLSAGLLIAAAVLAGMYAVAASIATTTAGAFTTAESASHQRMIEFADEVQSGEAANSAGPANCTLRVGSKNQCNSDARVAPLRVSPRQPANAGASVTRTAYQIDIALYQAHRQLPR